MPMVGLLGESRDSDHATPANGRTRSFLSPRSGLEADHFARQQREREQAALLPDQVGARDQGQSVALHGIEVLDVPDPAYERAQAGGVHELELPQVDPYVRGMEAL